MSILLHFILKVLNAAFHCRDFNPFEIYFTNGVETVSTRFLLSGQFSQLSVGPSSPTDLSCLLCIILKLT